jgi:ABC-type Fe3+/spermidine/putrescine transport system ATPase subunit
MVFQDYALFPHKTVAENIAFGVRMAGWTADRQQARVGQLLELVGLSGMGGRRVYDLSGGEQQRVALARALAPNPRLLLLDEPLGALDRGLRERLMGELGSILARAASGIEGHRPVTTIYVTHDQEEAFAVAGRIMVMNEGRIEQEGPPLELYRSPRTPFVARFLGMDNLLAGEVVGERPCLIETDVGLIEVEGDCEAIPGGKGILLIRPEAAEILDSDESGENALVGRVQEISFRGRYQIGHIDIIKDGRMTTLKLTFDIETPIPAPGESIHLALLRQKCQYYP